MPNKFYDLFVSGPYMYHTCTFMSLTHSLRRQCTEKSKREIESTQNNSSGKINVGIKRYTVMSHMPNKFYDLFVSGPYMYL
jgi:hypothetical protein